MLGYFQKYGSIKYNGNNMFIIHIENTTALTGEYTIKYKVYGK